MWISICKLKSAQIPLFSINYLNSDSESLSHEGGRKSLPFPWLHARILGSETLLCHLLMLSALSSQSAWSPQVCCLFTLKTHMGMKLMAGLEILVLRIQPAWCAMWLIPLRSCCIPKARAGRRDRFLLLMGHTCLSWSPLRGGGNPSLSPHTPLRDSFSTLLSAMDLSFGNKSIERKSLMVTFSVCFYTKLLGSRQENKEQATFLMWE